MQFKKPFLLFIASVVVIGIFGFSIWHRWSTDRKLAQQRIPTITPSAEFNHGAPWIRDVAISPVNPNLIASVGKRNVIMDTLYGHSQSGISTAMYARNIAAVKRNSIPANIRKVSRI